MLGGRAAGGSGAVAASPTSSARPTCSASPRRTARSPTAPTCIRGRSWAWATPTRTAPATRASPQDLDGVVSCSAVVDTELVSRDLAAPLADPVARVPESEFWKKEFNHARPVPHRIEDLVIYELHVGSLGFGKPGPGTFEDAIALLDYLVELGVNAVELLPVAEFNGTRTWGYGNSHHFAVNASTGGRDQFRHFVRECHRRGIAVLVDVVYNHFVPDGERAQWHYDSDREEHNLYYWYEGKPERLPQPRRRLPGQHVQRLRPAHERGDGAQAVHQQRRRLGGGLPRRRLPGRPDLGPARLQRAARRRPPGGAGQRGRGPLPARAVAHAAAGAALDVADLRGPFRLADDHRAGRGGRPGLRRHLVREVLSPPDRRHRARTGIRQPAVDRGHGRRRPAGHGRLRRRAGGHRPQDHRLSRVPRRGGQLPALPADAGGGAGAQRGRAAERRARCG